MNKIDAPDEKKTTAERRLISIIVPVYNEEANVAAAHEAISKVFEGNGDLTDILNQADRGYCAT
jgi:hypothetical protein